MNKRMGICGMLAWLLAGCDVILPPPPPLEETRLLPDAYAWQSFDILEEYAYMHLSQLICRQHHAILGCLGLSRRMPGAVPSPDTPRPQVSPWLRKACPNIRKAATFLGICHAAYTDAARLVCPRLSLSLTNLQLCTAVETDTTRINCPKVSSVLTGSGVCQPVKTPKGSLVHCPLAPPFESLDFGCLTSDDTPAVYVRFTTLPEATSVPLPEVFGTCRPDGAGPAVGEPPRYTTDEGYHVCLLDGNDRVPSGKLSSNDANARPVGLYLDYTQAHIASAAIEDMARQGAFSGRFSLVLDTVYLAPEERKKAFESLKDIFTFYRQFAAIPEAVPED